MKWKCHAKPAALGGRTCGHVNKLGMKFNSILCCESCGCTKKASDDRRSDDARAREGEGNS